MKERFNRDKMSYRIAHINIGIENKEDIINDMQKIVNPNFQDSHGTSYLHLACQAHSVEAVSVLLKLGANPNINDNRGNSPIMSALGKINENNTAIFELMLQYGLDLDKKEGDITLKEKIELFNDNELNNIINRQYCNKN